MYASFPRALPPNVPCMTQKWTATEAKSEVNNLGHQSSDYIELHQPWLKAYSCQTFTMHWVSGLHDRCYVIDCRRRLMRLYGACLMRNMRGFSHRVDGPIMRLGRKPIMSLVTTVRCKTLLGSREVQIRSVPPSEGFGIVNSQRVIYFSPCLDSCKQFSQLSNTSSKVKQCEVCW
jgi:hypothetical protein